MKRFLLALLLFGCGIQPPEKPINNCTIYSETCDFDITLYQCNKNDKDWLLLVREDTEIEIHYDATDDLASAAVTYWMNDICILDTE